MHGHAQVIMLPVNGLQDHCELLLRWMLEGSSDRQEVCCTDVGLPACFQLTAQGMTMAVLLNASCNPCIYSGMEQKSIVSQSKQDETETEVALIMRRSLRFCSP